MISISHELAVRERESESQADASSRQQRADLSRRLVTRSGVAKKMGKRKGAAKQDSAPATRSGVGFLGIAAILVSIAVAVVAVHTGYNKAPQPRPSPPPPPQQRSAASSKTQPIRTKQQLKDIDEDCAERMAEGMCVSDADTAAACAATCASAPLSASCEGWKRMGHCTRASAFMLVHCAGVCPPKDVSCLRAPPTDLSQNCPQMAASGQCEKNLARGYAYFLAQCFVSCGKRDPAMLLQALLDEVQNYSAPFPSGLANLAENVGDEAYVALDSAGRVVGGGGGSSEWKEATDESTGRVYYWHQRTRETTWDRPAELHARGDAGGDARGDAGSGSGGDGAGGSEAGESGSSQAVIAPPGGRLVRIEKLHMSPRVRVLHGLVRSSLAHHSRAFALSHASRLPLIPPPRRVSALAASTIFRTLQANLSAPMPAPPSLPSAPPGESARSRGAHPHWQPATQALAHHGRLSRHHPHLLDGLPD